ncbi:DAK2 domain-containing protein [Mycoplasmatota bacterium]|nr:DAK2 domain-containing protein [Mycoplasmatota bacterium]
MSTFKIDGSLFKQMIINGAVNLDNNSDYIDELNVFPVPDGDTGTNMKLTLNAGAKEIVNLNSNSIAEVAKKLSRGLLMGARGNSGVILSQLFRGFANGVEGHDIADTVIFAKALKKGVETAYKAVMKPVEGTILTVSRESADEVNRMATPEMSFEELLSRLVNEAKRSLKRTPDLLPVLKEVGVVDSGGAGLLVIYEGFKKAINGEILKLDENKDNKNTQSAQAQFNVEDITFSYCTEFIVQLDQEKTKTNPFTEQRLSNFLLTIGDSLVVVQDEDIVKVHVHTNEPGVALNFAQKYGEFLKLKIENMKEQHSTIVSEVNDTMEVKKEVEKKEYGIIAVCSGEGLANIFKEMGCDIIISGGQTMNPSTEDFLKAIKEVNAKNVIILPNNSNIIMAANQAADVTDDVDVKVIPTKTIPQGYSSLLIFNPTADLESNYEVMVEQMNEVKSGQVTYAVRDTQYNGIEILKDDYMGIFEKNIVVSSHDRLDVTLSLLNQMVDEDTEIVTVFYGDDVSEDEVENISEFIESNYKDVELEILEGNQPVYSYIIAIE